MKRKYIYALLLMIFSILVSGCWDIRDVNNRAFVAGVGLDVPENPGQKYQVTFQFWDPIKINKGAELVTLTESVEAESINLAVELMQSRIARRITFTHMQLLLVGEELARTQSFLDLSDFFRKNPEVALRLRLAFVQEKTAQEALESNPKLINSVTHKIIQMTQLERDVSLPRTNTFYFFLSDLQKSQGTAFGSRIILPDGFIIRHGGTVFDDWKLRGFLNAEETQAANWLVGIGQAVVTGRLNNGTYTYLSRKKDLDIKVIEEAGGKVKFQVKLQVDGSLTEEEGVHIDLTKSENISKMEKLFSQVIARQIKEAINKSQKEFGIDYLGFGQILWQKKPKVFEKINWQEEFPQVPIDVSVSAKLKRISFSK